MTKLQLVTQQVCPLPRSTATFRAVVFALFVAAPLAGCGVVPAFSKEPLANRQMQVPPGTPSSRVFACAEQTVAALSKTQGNWDGRVTFKDETSGRLESGNFPEKNAMGFRVSVVYMASAPQAQVKLKGAGPHFVDLGVEGAIDVFVQKTSACLASIPS